MNKHIESVAPPVFEIPNIRHFLAFRLLFGVRFYYPVFAVIFLDFGLSLSQFAVLNAVWAATIMFCEVPSGALADLLGRRALVVTAATLMVVEISVLCIVPLGNTSLVFAAFLLNRILSGLAEALASGADEALAYDTLKTHGRTKEWPRVLARLMRRNSLAFVAAMTIGALVYDATTLQTLLGHCGWNVRIEAQTALRYPLYLTLISAIGAWWAALRMRDPEVQPKRAQGLLSTVGESWRMTLAAGRWILATPTAWIVIAGGLWVDHICRLLVTLNSTYLRLIGLPDASFGLIGSGIALLGLVVARFLPMLEQRSLRFNFGILTILCLSGLAGAASVLPQEWGLIPLALIQMALLLTGYLVSHYLNEVTDSDLRATVLSFKGLAFNLAYGSIGLLYAGMLGLLRDTSLNSQTEEIVFRSSLPWFFVYGAVTCMFLVALIRVRAPTGWAGDIPAN